jgi:hypothetical protein
VRRVLATFGLYYSTFFLVDRAQDWQQPVLRNKWGRDFYTFPGRDPFHYSMSQIETMAKMADFEMTIDDDYPHPTQTMAIFKPI